MNAEMSPNLKTMDLRKIGSYDDIKNAYRRAASTQQDEILRILVQAGAHP